jgi:hypothetical protein
MVTKLTVARQTSWFMNTNNNEIHMIGKAGFDKTDVSPPVRWCAYRNFAEDITYVILFPGHGFIKLQKFNQNRYSRFRDQFFLGGSFEWPIFWGIEHSYSPVTDL